MLNEQSRKTPATCTMTYPLPVYSMTSKGVTFEVSCFYRNFIIIIIYRGIFLQLYFSLLSFDNCTQGPEGIDFFCFDLLFEDL